MTDEIKQLLSEANEKALNFFKENDFPNAEELYKQILRVHPFDVDANHMLSLTVAQNGRIEDAIVCAKEAASRLPDDFKVYNNLGLVHGLANQHHEAIVAFKKAIELNPTAILIYSNLGVEYKKSGQFNKSHETFRKTLESNPNHGYALFNYGAFLHETGMISEAKDMYLEAVRVDPEMACARYNLSSCYFLLRQYKQGWMEYEWRWKQYPKFLPYRMRFSEPFWLGEDLEGKSILIYNEQGIGDIFQFIRFARHLKNIGATVYVECPREIKELVEKCDGVDAAFDTNYLPAFDYHCSMMSLPITLSRRINVGFDGIKDTAEFPYIKPNGSRASSWDGYEDFFKIGIVWGGSPLHPNDHKRSCYLKQFEPLSRMNGVKLFSIQKDLRKRKWPQGVVDLTEESNFPIVDMSEHLSNFNHTALVIKEMDAIVTVDTAVAHLAGAMNKPVFVLLPRAVDWRWALPDEETPWYPSMRLVRWRGCWEDSFTRVIEMIEGYRS